MQQVATKGSQIAALPIELDLQPSRQGNANDQFRQALEQSANRPRDKDKKGEITPIWKAPEKSPSASQTDRRTAERSETVSAQSAAKPESRPAVPANTDSQGTEPAIAAHDKNEDTNWLELVESVKDYNENPDKAALSQVTDSMSGDDITLSDELSAKLDALLAKLGEDSAISNDEMSILAAIQEQLSAMETEVEGPVTIAVLFDQLSQKLNQMVAKAMDAGEKVESPKATALATALLTLQAEDADKTNPLAAQGADSSDDALEASAKLLLSLMHSEKQNAQLQTSGSQSALNEKLTAPQNLDKLLQSMQQLSAKGQSESVEAIADRVIKLLPATATEQQQQAVKNAVITGLNEMNAQLAQGREPGINLQDLIAGALSEANIQLDNAMKQQLEGQFTLLSNAMQTAQQNATVDADRQALASIDTSLRENTQIRSEMSKAQQAADGLDKPVNLTRAEGQQQLNEKIRWMINSRSSLAEIRLDPPELGSMQVRVNISGDTANVNFVVQSQHAKDALADAENRLREMLAEQGITLGESFVQQQDSQQSEEDGQFAGSGHSGDDFEGDDTQTQTESGTRKRDTNGIDDYA
ncbi:flagellar hook-length control protein FliK [Alteromonas ponticola]|uniref:Flagellar hook-length control protein-like C-terminal domain-containing protein n=1 Tax=Alteromonas ponticola TaxID=2720613 RepID=A0ABX1R2Z7_9ALTE|nr:flagellar hook-length control protein FliK [Alteromonas ponticola]NMH59623.1 hypothetical protein [Alteromonas ponticola]